MPHIKVNTGKISEYAAEIDSARVRLNAVRQSIHDMKYGLDWPVSNQVNSKINRLEDELYAEATSLTNCREYCSVAAQVYEIGSTSYIQGSQDLAKILENAFKFGTKVTGGILSGVDHVSELFKAGEKAKKITHTLKNGKMCLKGYNRVKGGLTSRYNFSTWVKKGAKDALDGGFNAFDKIAIIFDGITRGVEAGYNIYSSWNDENKSTEKKVYDTIANVGCAGAAVAIGVAGMVVGKVAGGAVAAACCAIPVVGPVIGAVAGVATSAIVSGAIGIIADTVMSEAVVSQVSDACENIVGAKKAADQVVRNKFNEMLEAENFADGVGKAAELVGAAVVEQTKFVATVAVEAAKTIKTVTVETVKNVGEKVKNVGKAVGNFFKGW